MYSHFLALSVVRIVGVTTLLDQDENIVGGSRHPTLLPNTNELHDATGYVPVLHVEIAILVPI